MGGEALRLIDVPASRPGSAGVWDRLSEAERAGDLIELGGKLSQELKAACSLNHGAAIGRFLEKFMANKKEAISAAQKAIETFKKLAQSDDHDKQAQGIVEAFAALYAGGALAVKYNVVPWNRQELREAVLTCCRDAIAVLNSKSAPASDSALAIDPLKALATLLSDESLVPVLADGKTAVPTQSIGRKRNRGTEFVVELQSGMLKGHAVVGPIHSQLIAALDASRLLQRDSEGNAAHNIRWPGSKKKIRAHRLVWSSMNAFNEWLSRINPSTSS